jgi:hypothetical protein
VGPRAEAGEGCAIILKCVNSNLAPPSRFKTTSPVFKPQKTPSGAGLRLGVVAFVYAT